MAVKYIKDNKTQETVYPITKSECIIDASNISNVEIDQLFDDSVNNSEVQESGMDYLNYNGLKHYHKKILEGVKTDLENVQVDLTGYATESWVKEQNYLTEHQDISNKVDSSDFEEVSQSLSESIENLSEEIFKRDFSTSSIDAQANSGDGVTYFTPDTHQIIKDGVNYGGSITAEEMQGTPDGDITLRAVTYIQDRTNSADTSFTLAPNYKYLFGERESLTITLEEITDSTIVNHYMFEFTSGSTATTLSLPSNVKWTTTPSIKPNKIYQISIENNLGVIQEWT